MGTVFQNKLYKDGAATYFSVHSLRFTSRDYLLIFVPYLVSGLGLALIGIAVWYSKPEAPASLALLIGELSGGIFAITGTDLYSPYWFFRLHIWRGLLPGKSVDASGAVIPVDRFRRSQRTLLCISVSCRVHNSSVVRDLLVPHRRLHSRSQPLHGLHRTRWGDATRRGCVGLLNQRLVVNPSTDPHAPAGVPVRSRISGNPDVLLGNHRRVSGSELRRLHRHSVSAKYRLRGREARSVRDRCFGETLGLLHQHYGDPRGRVPGISWTYQLVGAIRGECSLAALSPAVYVRRGIGFQSS
jgi:hypothetical protein